MRSLGSTWNTLAARDSAILNTKVVINGTEYTSITSPIIQQHLLNGDTLSVGNCIAASLKFTVMTTNTIPKSAKVVVKCQYVDGNTSTSWYEFGTFYVSKREVNDDLVALECYDAMLKGNQAFGGSSDAMNWPKPMQTVLNTIASRLGVSIDSRTSIRSNSTVYKCEYPGDMTLLEVLGHIGACNGGNWIITPENKLRLIPLTGSGSTVNVPVVLGEITTADSYTISGVTMVRPNDANEGDDEDYHVYSAGNTSGFVLTINPCPYACQTIADDLYNKLNGLVYQPFTATRTKYNPAAELGDTIVAGDVTSKLYFEERTYGLDFQSDIEAPGKDELEDEYPYPSEILRLQNSVVELSRNDEVLSSSIIQTQTEIATKVTAGEVESIIEQKADSIRLRAKKISWESDYSSMTENGRLECTGATINGKFTTKGSEDGYDTTITLDSGTLSLAGKRNSSSLQFDISLGNDANGNKSVLLGASKGTALLIRSYNTSYSNTIWMEPSQLTLDSRDGGGGGILNIWGKKIHLNSDRLCVNGTNNYGYNGFFWVQSDNNGWKGLSFTNGILTGVS